MRTIIALTIGAALYPGSAHAQATVTFSEHLAPILFKHCANCHRPGGSASFSLLTYQDARPRARQLATVTASRVMPPWQPEHGYGEFADERRLSEQEIRRFLQWAEQGAREGDPARLPSAPVWPGTWQLGEPDLVLTMPSYVVKPGGPDIFRNFVLPLPPGTGRFVKAWEFRPGNPLVVHHATLQIDAGGNSRRFDEQDREAGYEGLIAPSARAPDGFFLDWAPGHRPAVAVDGTAWPLPPAGDLVMMLHLRPAAQEETVQARIGLYFSDAVPSRQPVMVRLTRQHLDIPPGETRYEVADSYTLPVDVDVYTVQPHAHYLAREMRGFARLPNGTVQPLVLIKAWNFDWQDVYHYARPVSLPAGTTILMEYTYDNSASNRRNPNRPPRRVTYGQRTSDEMAELWFQVVPRTAGDRERLKASLSAEVLREEIVGRRMMIRSNPDDVALHDELGLMLAEVNDFGGALEAFRQSLRVNPGSAAARYNVAVALLGVGRPDQAKAYLEQALEADPLHARAQFQLGVLLQGAGDLGGAVARYREASRLMPGDAEVQLTAGVGLSLNGDKAAGAVHLRRALQLAPDWPNAQAALAWTLAVDRLAGSEERAEAVRLATRAVQGTGRNNADFLDMLAAALASAGQFDLAVATAEEALALAIAQAKGSATDQIRKHLAMFKQRMPYYEP